MRPFNANCVSSPSILCSSPSPEMKASSLALDTFSRTRTDFPTADCPSFFQQFDHTLQKHLLHERTLLEQSSISILHRLLFVKVPCDVDEVDKWIHRSCHMIETMSDFVADLSAKHHLFQQFQSDLRPVFQNPELFPDIFHLHWEIHDVNQELSYLRKWSKDLISRVLKYYPAIDADTALQPTFKNELHCSLGPCRNSEISPPRALKPSSVSKSAMNLLIISIMKKRGSVLIKSMKKRRSVLTTLFILALVTIQGAPWIKLIVRESVLTKLFILALVAIQGKPWMMQLIVSGNVLTKSFITQCITLTNIRMTRSSTVLLVLVSLVCAQLFQSTTLMVTILLPL